MHIGIANAYADSNVGGAAITIETAEIARSAFPGATIGLIPVKAGNTDVDFRVSLSRCPYLSVEDPFPGTQSALDLFAHLAELQILGSKSSLGRRVLNYDLLISKGGYMLGARTLRRIPGLLSASSPLAAAARTGVPFVIFPTSVGPFRSKPHEWYVKYLARHAQMVWARDSASYARLAKAVHGRSTAALAPDVVFGWNPGHGPDAKNQSSGLLVVCVRDSAHSPSRSGVLVRALRRMQRSGLVSRVLVTAQGGDIQWADAFASTFGTDAPKVVHTTGEPEDLASLYETADIVIAERLHAAIFSLLVGTPALYAPIDSDKGEPLLADLGLSTLVLKRSPSADEILSSVRRVLRAPLRDVIESTVARARASVEDLPRQLRQIVG